MNPVLRVLFIGTKSPASVWYMINKDILRYIWSLVVAAYKSHVDTNTISCLKVSSVSSWPEPKDICINMMPFIFGDESSIPEKYKHYWPLIIRLPINSAEKGKVGYLTIHESWVETGQSQRRPGVHTEAPGMMKRGGDVKTYIKLGWGGGEYKFHQCHGGIYMASNISNSCAVWKVKIINPAEIVGPHGDIEHLREFLGSRKLMEKDEIWWITDTTPHESLPLTKKQYRQYFRVVTSQVSVWYSDHSTENELGIKPNAEIISGNKFKKSECDE